MPTYEYRCKECCEYFIHSTSYERIKELEPMKCPQCGKEMDKIFNCNFILKGSGWARDGYVTKGSLKDLDRQTELEHSQKECAAQCISKRNTQGGN